MNRRLTRSLLAAGAGAATYLAASTASRHRPAASSLLLLGCVAGVGNVLAKATNAHQRIDVLVPAVASAASAASSAQTTANAAMPKSGGTFTGAVTHSAGLTTTTMHSTGNAQIDGTLTGGLTVTGGFSCDTCKINGFTLTLNHGDPTEPGGAPLSYSAAYCTSVRDYAAGIVTGLSNSGVFQ